MKPIKTIITCFLIALLAVSCEDYLDPINEVKPANDVSDPQVTINYPVEGKVVQASEEVATIIIKVIAIDDIELGSVTLDLDGAQIASFTSFKDYRRADIQFEYNNLTDGDHILTVTAKDLTGKSETKMVGFKKITIPTYTPLDGEKLYFPLDDHYLDLISQVSATVVGTPGFATGKLGDAYAGATDAYLSYPSEGIVGNNFSAAFWYKINAVPDRAGIFMISHPPVDAEDRTKGLRFAREADGTKQKFWLNIGNGIVDSWFVPPSFEVTDNWMHIAFTVSETHAIIYINGELAAEGDYEGPVIWTDCSSITLMSGAPNVIYWDHFSDLSLMDELHIFNKVISADEVQSLYSVK